MLRFVPFDPEHFRYLALQGAQFDQAGFTASPAYAEMLRTRGFALTALYETADPAEARVAGCAGVLHQWRGRALAWAFIGSTRPSEWTAIARRMASGLAAAERGGVWRIEAHADAGFRPAQRLLEVLGFEREGLERAFSPTGRDCWLYARINRAVLAPSMEAAA